jgi:hypothetical protein
MGTTNITITTPIPAQATMPIIAIRAHALEGIAASHPTVVVGVIRVQGKELALT